MLGILCLIEFSYILFITSIYIFSVKRKNNNIKKWDANTLLNKLMEPLNKKGKGKTKQKTVCIMTIKGKNARLIFTDADGYKAKKDDKNIALPDDSYYLTDADKLGKVNLKAPMNLYVLDNDSIENLKFEGIGTKPEFDADTNSKLMSGNFITSIMGAFDRSLGERLPDMGLGVCMYWIAVFIKEVLVSIFT